MRLSYHHALLVPLLAEVGVQFCKIAILHITANDGPIHPQPFADLALRPAFAPTRAACLPGVLPLPGMRSRRVGHSAQPLRVRKGVQPQNRYFGRAGSGSGTWTARLLVAASSWARSTSSTR